MKLEGLKSPVSVFMQTKISEVKEDDNVLEIISAMIKSKTDIVFVKDNEKMTGVITSSDIFKAISQYKNFEEFTVKELISKVKAIDFMSSCDLNGENACLQISSEQSIENAMRVMAKSEIHHLVVVDNKGKIVGTISSKEVINALKVIRW